MKLLLESIFLGAHRLASGKNFYRQSLMEKLPNTAHQFYLMGIRYCQFQQDILNAQRFAHSPVYQIVRALFASYQLKAILVEGPGFLLK
jgi:hypothetical protein